MSLQSTGLPAVLKHDDHADGTNRPVILDSEFISEDEARRRREQLNRRPSYRLILKDLETVGGEKPLKKEIEENNLDRVAITQSITMNSVPGSSIYAPPATATTNGALCNTARVVSNVSPRTKLDVVNVARAAVPSSVNFLNNGGYLSARTAEDEVSDWTTGMSGLAYNSTSPLSSVSSSSGIMPPPDSDESNRKRQVRLLKNREAAKECRRKKKEYVKCLENRVAVLENQNKALIEELKTLKELYCRKEKNELQ